MPPKSTRSSVVVAPTANRIAANSTRGQEEDALGRYASAARTNQFTSTTGRPSALDRTKASDGN